MRIRPLTEYWRSRNESAPVPSDAVSGASSTSNVNLCSSGGVSTADWDEDENAMNKLNSDTDVGQDLDTTLESTPPPPPRERRFPSLARSHSTPPSGHLREISKILRSPSFLNEYNRVRVCDANDLEDVRVVRKKEERKLLFGHACKCCSMYYDALGLSSPEKRKRIDQVISS